MRRFGGPAPEVTPWGESQDRTVVADGIVFHSTAGHGGFHLSAERLAEMHPALRKRNTRFCPANWFEEDCEAALVALAFPQFMEANLDLAAKMVREIYPDQYRDWLDSRDPDEQD
jgi:hypothetical protein